MGVVRMRVRGLEGLHVSSSVMISFYFQVASCDADGVVKMWDARMVAEIGTMEAGQHPLNSLCLDRSATRLAAASNDGTVKVSWGGSTLDF